MKLIDNDRQSVWVQRKDLALVLKARKPEEVPEEILSRYKSITEDGISEPEVYEQFTGKDNIEFVNSLDYIVNKRVMEILDYTELLQYLNSFMPDFFAAYNKAINLKTVDSEENAEYFDRLDLMRHKRQEIMTAIASKKPTVVFEGRQSGPRKHLNRGFRKNKKQKED